VTQLVDVDGDQLITFRDLNEPANAELADDVNQKASSMPWICLTIPRGVTGSTRIATASDDLFGWDFPQSYAVCAGRVRAPARTWPGTHPECDGQQRIGVAA